MINGDVISRGVADGPQLFDKLFFHVGIVNLGALNHETGAEDVLPIVTEVDVQVIT